MAQVPGKLPPLHSILSTIEIIGSVIVAVWWLGYEISPDSRQQLSRNSVFPQYSASYQAEYAVSRSPRTGDMNAAQSRGQTWKENETVHERELSP